MPPLPARPPEEPGPVVRGGSVSHTPAAQGPSWKRLAAAVVLTGAAPFAFRELTTAGSARHLETACASILNVVNPEGSTFERIAANASAGDTVMRLLYTVTTPDGQAKRTVILCAFDGTPRYGSTPSLTAVSLNGRQLGPARLAFLNRFWLPSLEATAALPSADPTAPRQTQTPGTSAPG